MNLGVLGGTFDPVHNAHLAIAEVARGRLHLDVVLFIPAGQPQLKGNADISLAAHRVEMVRLAIADKPYFRLSTIEVERLGPTYTVDTIAQLKSELRSGDEIFFIMGWGSLSELPRWHEPERLVELCFPVAVPRPGYPRPNLKSLERSIPGLSKRVLLLDEPQINISATDIRSRIARGLSIKDLVPEAVDKYIREHGLYTTEESRKKKP